jgi:hypothetical protein
MPLITLDAQPSGQVLINTDHVIRAVKTNQGVTIYLREGHFVHVPHSTVADLFDDMQDGVARP